MKINFYLASGNEHKAAEFKSLFDTELLDVAPAPEAIDVVEDGVSFTENALLKAKAYYERFNIPVVSDDSGIVVEAIPDDLGIHSARFGGEGLTDKDRALLLIEKMKSFEGKERAAYFVCVLCFYLSPDEIYFFEGRLQGQISKEFKGEHGFGYDPVFMPDGLDAGKTFAMDPEWKKENSHRASACVHAEKFFKERDCQSK